jgi:hypothetical protein
MRKVCFSLLIMLVGILGCETFYRPIKVGQWYQERETFYDGTYQRNCVYTEVLSNGDYKFNCWYAKE